MANLQEGGRRISAAGRLLLKISACIALCGPVLFVLSFTDLSLYFPLASSGGALFPLLVAFYFAVPGFVLLLAGRIVEGFGMPQSEDRSSTHGTSNIAAPNQ